MDLTGNMKLWNKDLYCVFTLKICDLQPILDIAVISDSLFILVRGKFYNFDLLSYAVNIIITFQY